MKRGFTIVEILVVVAVLSILISLAAFGSNVALNSSRNAEGSSKTSIIKGALEKYYAQNNEYPSAASLVALAGGTDGRALTTAQYNAIASKLQLNVDVLNSGRYKFMPCAIGSNQCCTNNGSGECVILDTDSKYIVYMTRSAADVTAASVRTFKSPSSGCAFTIPAPVGTDDTGYSSYYIAYFNPAETDYWRAWRWYSSNHGPNTHGSMCVVNQFN